MGIGRFLGWTTIVLVAASVAGVYVGWDQLSPLIDGKPVLSGVRKPLFPENSAGARTSTVTATADDAQFLEPRRAAAGDSFNIAAVGPMPGVSSRVTTAEPPEVEPRDATNEPQAAPNLALNGGPRAALES